MVIDGLDVLLRHNGFSVLRDALKGRPHWVFTSNVDGQFQRAGLSKDRIVEIHGSIHHLQCATPCSPEIWSARDLNIDIDPVDCWRGPLPTCPQCGVVRPNILMFGDGQFLEARTETQWLFTLAPKRGATPVRRYRNWCRNRRSNHPLSF